MIRRHPERFFTSYQQLQYAQLYVIYMVVSLFFNITCTLQIFMIQSTRGGVCTEQVQKQTSTTERLQQSHTCKLETGKQGSRNHRKNAVLACTTKAVTMPLKEARTQGSVDVYNTGCLPIDSQKVNTSTTKGMNGFQLTRIFWTSQPKTSVATCVATSQRLAVTTEQTTADD